MAILEQCIARTQACRVQPARFFVAWQGVLTLAFDGFPPSLAALKGLLSRVCAGENAGSKWPKATLGCLRDSVRLTPDELQTLLRVCEQHSARLRAAPALAVNSLQLVLFRSRSLEQLLSVTELPLQQPPDESPSSQEERTRAATVHAEAANPSYWTDASRDGGRETHYRGAASGATLVAPLGLAASLLLDVEAFRAAVDAALPNYYVWLADESLHMTVRALL